MTKPMRSGTAAGLDPPYSTRRSVHREVMDVLLQGQVMGMPGPAVLHFADRPWLLQLDYIATSHLRLTRMHKLLLAVVEEADEVVKMAVLERG